VAVAVGTLVLVGRGMAVAVAATRAAAVAVATAGVLVARGCGAPVPGRMSTRRRWLSAPQAVRARTTSVASRIVVFGA